MSPHGAREVHSGRGRAAQPFGVGAVADEGEAGSRDGAQQLRPGPQQDVLPLLEADPAHADGERTPVHQAAPEGGGQRQFGACPGPVLSWVGSAGAEVLEVHAVADHRPPGVDALGLARAAFGLADTEHPVGPADPVPLPAQGERGGGSADRVEGPGVGLEDGGHGAARGEPPGESGLGAVGVQQVGPHLAEQPPGADQLGGQPGPGDPPGPPGEHFGPGGAGCVAEGAAGRAADDGAEAVGGLCADEVGDDPGHAAVDGLYEMEDGRGLCRPRLCGHVEWSPTFSGARLSERRAHRGNDPDFHP